MTSATEAIEHAKFCLPRPGAPAPRIETFEAYRYGPDGITVIARPVVSRCVECAAETVDGVPSA